MSYSNVIIAGSRNFCDYKMLEDRCQSVLANWCAENGCDVQIITGGARGADELGKRYAQEHQWEYQEFPANWDLHGKAAGPIRNREMAKTAHVLIAFWDGRSRGTRNMINEALHYGLDVHVYVQESD